MASACTITITFGDQAENHVGMQTIGKLADRGFDAATFERIERWAAERGLIVERHDLCALVDVPMPYFAQVLVVRDAVHAVLGPVLGPAGPDALLAELASLSWDTKARMYNRVVNKHARHNLCFDEEAQEPDYESGRGRIVAYDTVPLLARVRETLPTMAGEEAASLAAEGNLYYDVTRCGIGYHGDGERRKVAAVRLGCDMPLHFQWYRDSKPFGRNAKILLRHGDMYFMSEKAVGRDWRRKVPALRHAAGAPKYTTIIS